MCGICCILDVNTEKDLNFWKDCITHQSRICRRGPDGSNYKQVAVHENRNVLLSGHILHLRGHMTRQPLEDKDGNMILWNGEIFGGDIEVSEEENDTKVLLSTLSSCTDVDGVLSTLAKVQGPWSIVFWQESTRCLWFGRDMFGRRSLLWHLPVNKDDRLLIASAQIHDQDFQEIPSVGLFCINFTSSAEVKQGSDLEITLYPRQESVWPGSVDKVDGTKSLNDALGLTDKSLIKFTLDNSHTIPCPMPKLNKSIPNQDGDLPSGEGFDTKIPEDQQKYLQYLIESDHIISSLADQLINILQQSVTVRVFNQPLLKHYQQNLPHNLKRHITTSMDQCSVQGPDVNNTQTLIDHLPCSSEEKRNSSSYEMSGIKYAKPANTSTTSSYMDSKSAQYLTSSTSSGRHSLTFSSPISGTASGSSKWDASDHWDRSSASVAILFSGGIDSTVLAALVDRCLPKQESIDLINVAFEQNISPGKQRGSQEEMESQRWAVPDRLSGYSALSELNPNRKWNFVEVNVTLQELQEARSQHVRHLVYPLETVLDDSIGCAVWFAARGQGIIGQGVRKESSYSSKARVILCGMGADEQFAGYSRHRGKFEEFGWQGLVDEMELEITRISARNLGRDDRIITDHGKESRFPFLDENVVEFLSALPVQHKTNLNLPRGLGEKLLLRVGATKLGLKTTAVLPKRAIQFGSRIAKMENNKEKASDKCTRLKD